MLAGDISLNISRGRISSSKCCVPFCDVKYPFLRSIPKDVRYNIMKTKRFFIPARSLACDEHRDFSVWPQIIIPNERSTFTAEQIEEMVDLLRFDSKLPKDNLSKSRYIKS